MRAVSYTKFGPASDVLETIDIPTPTPAAGEVLVRLVISGVNPSDAKARAGARPGVTKPAFDRIVPHSDGAGVIEAVGDGVATSRVGERVWIWNGQWQRAFGTATEFISLPSVQAVALPEGVSFDTGATLGIPGLTAAHTVYGGGDVAGKVVLISGGAGAVGHNAVQLAKSGGATVIATCSETSMDRVRAAGADHVLDYRSGTLANDILQASGGHGVDRALEVEFGQNADLLTQVMRPHGVVAAYGSGKNMTPVLPYGPFMFKAITVDFVLIYLLQPAQRQTAIDRLHKALAEGALTPDIQTRFDLADCATAHDRVMTPGRAGAVLLDIS